MGLIWGGADVPLGGGTKSASNTMLPGPRPTIVPIGILIRPAVWPQQTWAENWGCAPFLGRGSWVPIYHNVAWTKTYLSTKWHLDPCSRLATTTIDMGRKLEGGSVPFLGRGARSPSNTVSLGSRPTFLLSGILIQPFGHNRYGPKIGDWAVPLWGRVTWVPI